MSENKYQNFEIMLMEVDVLKEEIKKELEKGKPDEAYIEEIINYGAWGDANKYLKANNSMLVKAFRLLHKTTKYTLLKAVENEYSPLVIKSLLEDSSIDPNVQDRHGYNALIEASLQNRLQALREILKHPKTDPNIQNKFGDTSLHLASERGHSQVVQELLKHPLTDPNVKDANGYTALHLASCNKKGHSQVVKALLKHSKTDPNIQTKWGGETALSLASRWGYSKIVEEILKHPNIDPNVQNKDGSTTLIMASWMGLSQVVKEILKHPKIDVTVTNKFGQTAWDLAKPKIREQFPDLNAIKHIVKAKDKEIKMLKSLLNDVKAKLPKGCEELKRIKDILS